MNRENEEPKLIHGGDWYGYRKAYGKMPLDFSININPLGMPGGVVNAIREAAAFSDHYPDPRTRRLRDAIAQKEGIPQEWILCANGAADLIYRLIPAMKKQKIQALIPAPSFSEYEQAVLSFGGSVHFSVLHAEDGFAVREDLLSQITRDTDLVFLCQPNNPTGVTMDRDLLDTILHRCEQVSARLVIDECFIDFLDEPEAYTMKDRLAAHPNLFVLRAFTKSYAMAGIRLGYALCADTDFLKNMQMAGQPWAVSVPAEEAGIAALKETGYLEETRRFIKKERAGLLRQLNELGFCAVPGEANFLLFQVPEEVADSFQRSLEEQGILIRSCANFRGLSKGWFRIAVRTEKENARLMQVMSAICRNMREEEQPCPKPDVS